MVAVTAQKYVTGFIHFHNYLQSLKMEEDLAESGDDQPLDLTTSQSSVTTPMLAEKRILLPEDSNPPNEPKRSRLSENGGMFFV